MILRSVEIGVQKSKYAIYLAWKQVLIVLGYDCTKDDSAKTIKPYVLGFGVFAMRALHRSPNVSTFTKFDKVLILSYPLQNL